MDYRQGKCSACGAEYKIPASFQHDAAKCKACGGVVAIGPVTSDVAAPAPIPARPVAKRPEEPAAPRKGGTLERLKAERAAAETPAAKPAAPKPAAKPAARPAAPVKAGATRSTPPAREKVGAGAAAGGRSSGRASARRERGGEDGGGRGRRGAAAREKKKPNLALIGGSVAALIVLGGAGWWFFLRDDGANVTQAAETEQAPVAPAEGAATDAPDAAADAAAEPAADAPAEGAADPAAAAPAEGEAPAKPAEAPKPAGGDPASVDLSLIEDFGPAAGTTDEEWADIQEQVALFLANDGARSNRALVKLEEYGRKAVPAIVNQMKTLDFATDEGRMFGDNLQRTLEKIANGTNFGWKYTTEPKDVYFNKRVVEGWANLWRQAEANIEAWINAAKLEEKDPEAAAELRELYGDGAAPAADEGLDLDVD